MQPTAWPRRNIRRSTHTHNQKHFKWRSLIHLRPFAVQIFSFSLCSVKRENASALKSLLRCWSLLALCLSYCREWRTYVWRYFHLRIVNISICRTMDNSANANSLMAELELFRNIFLLTFSRCSRFTLLGMTHLRIHWNENWKKTSKWMPELSQCRWSMHLYVCREWRIVTHNIMTNATEIRMGLLTPTSPLCV